MNHYGTPATPDELYWERDESVRLQNKRFIETAISPQNVLC